jgi:hypothetical protein
MWNRQTDRIEGARDVSTAVVVTEDEDFDAIDVVDNPGHELAKPVAGGIFVLFWLIAIAAWIVGAHMDYLPWGAFIVDVGIIFAAVGFAAPFLTWQRTLRAWLIGGLIGILAFVLADFVDILVLRYFLRIFFPLLALLAPMIKTISGIKVWY